MKKTSRDKFLKHFLVFFSFIIITFYCSMLIDSSEMELKTFGSPFGCSSTLTYAECRKGPYPKSSYKWKRVMTSSDRSTGCYVELSTSAVYFNRAVDGTDCTSERNCLCKKGEFPPCSAFYIAALSIYLFESNFFHHFTLFVI